MAKNPASEKITHAFVNDGSPYDKCIRCESYRHENGRQYCAKYDRFTPTIAFSCYKCDLKRARGGKHE